MLAKELKIKNIKRQRKFIEEQLLNRLKEPGKDGDTSYRYVGDVFPEVITYFEDEGFIVEPIKTDSLVAAMKGLPVYLFTISKDVVLNEEELKVAEEMEMEIESNEDRVAKGFDAFFSAVFSRDHQTEVNNEVNNSYR